MSDITANIAIDMVFDAVEEKQFCEGFVQGYQHDEATITQSQTYAECIYILRPEEGAQQQLLMGVVVLSITLIIIFLFALKKKRI